MFNTMKVTEAKKRREVTTNLLFKKKVRSVFLIFLDNSFQKFFVEHSNYEYTIYTDEVVLF